jgi:hypothetical protein
MRKSLASGAGTPPASLGSRRRRPAPSLGDHRTNEAVFNLEPRPLSASLAMGDAPPVTTEGQAVVRSLP